MSNVAPDETFLYTGKWRVDTPSYYKILTAIRLFDLGILGIQGTVGDLTATDTAVGH